ncbi:hypothetical protein D029_3760 [Vibrio parahaemolyticus 970107]|nr:hypothetical protein D029_3760 [Vibrio parahaemolyticus 970107]
MLFTFEQILDVNKEDKDWNTTIIAQLKKHKLHLSKSGSVKREEWSEHLTKLINESLS